MPRFPQYFRDSRAGHVALSALSAMFLVALVLCPSRGGAVTFTVTRTDDQLDSSPGDGLCSALNGGGCSLRAAVQEANALSGADGIYLPPGTYSLTLAGAGEDFAASGDLDITSAIALLGTGWAVTTIAMASYADRLFDIQGFSSLELGDVTLAGGLVDGVGGGDAWLAQAAATSSSAGVSPRWRVLMLGTPSRKREVNGLRWRG